MLKNLLLCTDNAEGTSYDESPPFQMAGDDETETALPAVFLFSKEGSMIQHAMEEHVDGLEPLRVVISNFLRTLSKLKRLCLFVESNRFVSDLFFK